MKILKILLLSSIILSLISCNSSNKNVYVIPAEGRPPLVVRHVEINQAVKDINKICPMEFDNEDTLTKVVYDSLCTCYLKTQNNDMFNQTEDSISKLEKVLLMTVICLNCYADTTFERLFISLQDLNCPCVFRYFSSDGNCRDVQITMDEWSNFGNVDATSIQ